MDPTAPKDNSTQPSNPVTNSPPPPNDPIQPGGFVVSGGDADKVFREPASPASPPPPPKLNLAGPASPASQPSPPVPPAPPPNPLPVSPTPTQTPPPTTAALEQPNPTPYQPPPGETQTQSGSSPKIDKLRLLTIGLGALFVIILAAALGWFLFVGRPSQEAANVQIEETEVEEPSLPPKNKTGGFAILPTPSEATPEATPGAASQ